MTKREAPIYKVIFLNYLMVFSVQECNGFCNVFLCYLKDAGHAFFRKGEQALRYVACKPVSQGLKVFHFFYDAVGP